MSKRDEKRAETLRNFVQEHPDGWSHDEWERLVQDCHHRGLIDPGDEDALGRALERERIVQTLATLPVKGLGPKRREKVAEHFEHLWMLRNASTDDLASVPSVTRPIAEDLHRALH